jgi:uncharacterized protein
MRAGVVGITWLIMVGAVGVSNAWASDTRLMGAVRNGDRVAVRTLLASTVDVNEAERDGTTALHWAAHAGDLEVVRLLLGAGARPDVVNDHGMTPLALAAVNGSAEMLTALIEAGADPHARLRRGQTVLMTAARTGNPDAVSVLLAHGADVNAREEMLGETALMWAAADDHPAVVTVLVEHGADVDARSDVMQFPRDRFGDGASARFMVLPRGGWTPLMYAARQNARGAVGALADAGADLDLTDPDGTTALILAVINAHYDLAALLVHKGADPNIGDSRGMTALYAAVDMQTLDETPGRPAPTPSGTLDARGLMSVLLARGADPNVRLTARVLERLHNAGDPALGAGSTPLMRAARKGDVATVRLLLEHGADPRLATANGATAVMYAAGLGGLGRFGIYELNRGTEADRMEIVSLCLERGADVRAANDAGQTALHIAALEREDAFVQLLADRGARLDAADKDGRTPLDLALGVGVRARGGMPAAPRESTAALLRELMRAAATAESHP